MVDHSTSVMIALLPTSAEWSTLELPHMTLVYAGDIKDLPIGAYNEMAKECLMIAMSTNPITLKAFPGGLEVFGKDDEKVNVLRLIPTQDLMDMRKFVEHWNASEWPFNPHITVNDFGDPLPEGIPNFVVFNRILVSFGNDAQTFTLRRN